MFDGISVKKTLIFGMLETGTNYSFSIFKIHKQIHKFVSNLREDRDMYFV